MGQSAITAAAALGLIQDPNARPHPGPINPAYQAGLGPFTLTPDEAQSEMRAKQEGAYDPADLIQTKRPDLEKYLTDREAAEKLTPLYQEMGGDWQGSIHDNSLPYFQGQMVGNEPQNLQQYQEGRPLAALPHNAAIPQYDEYQMAGDVYQSQQNLRQALQLAATRYPHLVGSLKSIGEGSLDDPNIAGGVVGYTDPQTRTVTLNPYFVNNMGAGGLLGTPQRPMTDQQYGLISVLNTLNHELTHAAMDRFGYGISEAPPSQAEADLMKALGFTVPSVIQQRIKTGTE